MWARSCLFHWVEGLGPSETIFLVSFVGRLLLCQVCGASEGARKVRVCVVGMFVLGY